MFFVLFCFVLLMYSVNIIRDFIVQEPLENPNPLAKAELNLLAHLVGGATKKPESELLIDSSRVRVCASSVSWGTAWPSG